MRKLLFIIALFTFGLESFAQSDSAGVVFVSNDYRNVASSAMVVKWFANKVYYPGGFNVFRQLQGEQSWTKVTATPLNVQDRLSSQDLSSDEHMKSYFDFVKKMSYDEFQEHLARVFVAIKTMKTPRFAEIMGTIYYDVAISQGQEVRYKVEGITASGATEYINTTKFIRSGPYIKTAPPKGITVERLADRVLVNWAPDETSYYGVHVYQKSNKDTKWKRLTEEPRHLQKLENQKGVAEYPDICLEDTTIDKSLSYQYKLTVIDYFGQEGSESEIVEAPYKDFEAPEAPYGLSADPRILHIELTWEAELALDAAGFNVYRHHHKTGEKSKRNDALLSINTFSFADDVPEAGGYYYSVAAVDQAGNEGVSGEIFLEVHDLIPPDVPQNVRVSTEPGIINLTWDAVQSPDLKGYYIYRSLNDDDNSDNEFIIVNAEALTETAYKETLAKFVKNEFVYTVVAEDTNHNRSKPSEISIVQLPDVTPPLSPFIRHIHTDHGKIMIEWLPYHEEGLLGFDIYRSSYGDSTKFIKLNPDPIDPNQTGFEDQNLVEGVHYYYYLTATDIAGNTSAPSNVYTGDAFIEGNAFEPKISIKGLKVKNDHNKRAVLDWEIPEQEELLGVVVYRGESAASMKPVTGRLAESQYIDGQLQKDKTYLYQIKAFDSKGHSVKSEVKQITTASK